MAVTGDQQSKRRSASPMPSLIYNGGILGNNSPQNALAPKETLTRGLPPLRQATLGRYNRKAEQLLKWAVAGLAIIVGGLWLFSITTQFSLIHWSKSPEKNLINKTTDNWREAFHTDSTSTVSIDELKTEIKDRLLQITAQFTSTTPTVAASTTTATATTPIATTSTLRK